MFFSRLSRKTKKMVNRGMIVQAIKNHQAEHDLGLKEAKRQIDEYKEKSQ